MSNPKQKNSKSIEIDCQKSGEYLEFGNGWRLSNLVKEKKNSLPYSRKEMVDSLCAKWNSMCNISNDQNQLSSKQFRDLARTETDDELFKDCCNSAENEGLTLSEFMALYV
jgi:hypothetical protein